MLRVVARRSLHAAATATRTVAARRAATGVAAGGVALAAAAQLRVWSPRDSRLALAAQPAECLAADPGALTDAQRRALSDTDESDATIALGRGWRLWLKVAWRCIELAWCLFPAASWAALHYTLPLGIGTYVFTRSTMLDLLVACLARCGPVGIKWGQWASTRYDLFEEDFCEAVATLTNHAPCHSVAHTRQAIEDSFGVPLEELFESFDEVALASGSIGQVHTAVIRSNAGGTTGGDSTANAGDGSTLTVGNVVVNLEKWAGRKVAVKVQHPNLPRRLALDMTILRGLGRFFSKVAPDMRIGETVSFFPFYHMTEFSANLIISFIMMIIIVLTYHPG
jgi:hypothetical protein